MLNQYDRLLVERSGLVDWLGLRVGPPQAYCERKRGILTLLDSASPKGWDDDDIAADEEDEDDDEEDELLPDDDAEDAEDDDDEDDVEEEDE
jgi:hypothetical protein